MSDRNDDVPMRYNPSDAVLRAEREVAGSAVMQARLADVAAEKVKPEDFYDPRHGIVFGAACELSGRGQHVSPITVNQHLTATGQAQGVTSGGRDLVTDLACNVTVPTESAVAAHAEIVAADARRRRFHMACARGVAASRPDQFPAEDADEIIETVIAEIEDAAALHAGKSQSLDFDKDMLDLICHLTNPVAGERITTPWTELDRKVKLLPGSLVIVGARPAIGKSVFGGNIAVHHALTEGTGALIFSMEMNRSQLMTRILADKAQVPLYRLLNPEENLLTQADWDQIDAASKRLAGIPLEIDDTANITVPHIRARVKAMQRAGKDPKLVVVDYLQLVTGRAERRELVVAEFSRGLKLLAKELGICVIALSQLNRGPEQRPDKRPGMSDLRESGALEQDADVVILLHREDAYDPDVRAGEADLIIAKARMGVTGVVTVAFLGHYARFADMAA